MPPEPGTCESREIGADAIETLFAGHITRDVAERGRAAAFDLPVAKSVRFWIIDLSGMSGFEASVRDVGFKWMKEFRARGGKHMYIVTQNPFARMMGSALAFATGIPVAFVPTRDHAEKRIAQERA